MLTAEIKRGATFKAQLIFDAEEWAAIYPWSGVVAEVGQGRSRYPLAVSVDVAQMTITVTAPPDATRRWQSGAAASFDVWITSGGDRLSLPASTNIPLRIVEGVGR